MDRAGLSRRRATRDASKRHLAAVYREWLIVRRMEAEPAGGQPTAELRRLDAALTSEAAYAWEQEHVYGRPLDAPTPACRAVVRPRARGAGRPARRRRRAGTGSRSSSTDPGGEPEPPSHEATAA